MTEPFGKFKRKHGKGSDREHVPLAAINSYAGGAYPTCRLATGVRGAQPRRGRTLAHWTRVDHDYERIRMICKRSSAISPSKRR